MGQVWRVIYPVMLYFMITMMMLLLFPMLDALTVTLLGALFSIPVLGYLFYRDQQMRGRNLFHRGITLKFAVFAAVSGIGACITVNNLIQISGLPVLFPGFSDVAEKLYSPPLWVQIMAIGIVIPIVEELVFRALGFARIRNNHGYWTAAVLSSLLFALYHGNAVQAMYAFILGMCMCWVYERAGTILSSILFHQSANLISVVLTASAGFNEAYGGGISFYIMTLAAAAVWILSYRRMKKAERQ